MKARNLTLVLVTFSTFVLVFLVWKIDGISPWGWGKAFLGPMTLAKILAAIATVLVFVLLALL